MQAQIHDERELFEAIDRSGARVVLIGRRALVAYGLPVLTAAPTRSPKEARRSGRYVLENGDHVDVMLLEALRGSRS